MLTRPCRCLFDRGETGGFKSAGDVSAGASADRWVDCVNRSEERFPREATPLRGTWILVGPRDAKLLHSEVQRGPLDSQTCGRSVRARDDPPGLLESLANVIALRVLHGNCPK